MTLKQINAKILSLGKAQAKTNLEIHEVLCHITMHGLTHDGDVSAYDRLLEAVKGVHRKAIIAWILGEGIGRFENGVAKLNKSKFNEMRENVTLDELLQTIPWFEDVPTVAEDSLAFDELEALKRFVKNCTKASESKRERLHPELETEVRNLLAKFALKAPV